jgi:chromosome segregation ATPase
MTKVSRQRARAVALAILAAMPTAAVTGAAAQSLDSIIQAQAAADREAAAAQERVGKLNDEANDAAGQYRQALADVDSLGRFNAQLRTQVKSQDEEVALIGRQLGEVDTTQREIQPLMQKMVDHLVKFVDLDVPFLIEERKDRVTRLQEIMPRADVTISEKYRRILEAYQIELDYGRSLDTYQGKLAGAEGAEEKTVDFVRLGRVSLMYQTPDGNETGYWNQNDRQWVIDDDYKEAVLKAIKVAKKVGAPDLLEAPVPAPKAEVQS